MEEPRNRQEAESNWAEILSEEIESLEPNIEIIEREGVGIERKGYVEVNFDSENKINLKIHIARKCLPKIKTKTLYHELGHAKDILNPENYEIVCRMQGYSGILPTQEEKATRLEEAEYMAFKYQLEKLVELKNNGWSGPLQNAIATLPKRKDKLECYFKAIIRIIEERDDLFGDQNGR